MSKKIKFISNRPHIEFMKPAPASTSIPRWFKELPAIIDRELTSKRCVPMLDGYTAGYFIYTSCDLYWDGESFTHNANGYEPVSQHLKSQVFGIDFGDEYSDQPFKFLSPWVVKTPKGYSTMFTHPVNREELPFKSFTAVVDTDNHTLPINFPFMMKSGFTGTIPAGTPIVQVIPFKRDDWSSDVDDTSGYDDQTPGSYWFKPPMAYYKRHFWKKKKYQ